MKWSEFEDRYIVEAEIIGSVDIRFADNTPLYPADRPRIRKIQRVRVLERENFKKVKEYEISLDAFHLRETDNLLRNAIMKDFKIEETGTEGIRRSVITAPNPLLSAHFPVLETG